MYIVKSDKNTFPLVSHFVQPYEEKCIFLSSYIRRKSDNIYIFSKSPKPNEKDILGVIYLDSSLFHCIPNPDVLDSVKLLEFLKKSSEKHKIKCISGESMGTDLFINLLKSDFGEPYQTNHYKLMIEDEIQNPPDELYNNDQIVHCTLNDMEILFPIQKKYLNEEVAPFGKQVSDAEVSIGLRQILTNQLCLALESDGEIVAKANTNAIGINWIQLGGIYTHPMYRRNGYAWHLVAAICRRTYKAGKKAALFVKDINVPAMELYKKIGFTECGLYEIGYYN